MITKKNWQKNFIYIFYCHKKRRLKCVKGGKRETETKKEGRRGRKMKKLTIKMTEKSGFKQKQQVRIRTHNEKEGKLNTTRES